MKRTINFDMENYDNIDRMLYYKIRMERDLYIEYRVKKEMFREEILEDDYIEREVRNHININNTTLDSIYSNIIIFDENIGMFDETKDY